MAAEHGDGQLDALLDRAVDAVNSGRLDDARRLAHEARALDHDNADVDDLLTGPPESGGVLRRPTIMFCDLVGSTALSSRHDPEVYRRIVGRYKETCREILERTYGGRIMAVKGDGVLALFGYPVAHEDDAGRAVCAGLELLDAIRALSVRAEREVGEPLSARVGVHRGLSYIDAREGDVYGLAVNVAARLHELAEPGTLIVSAAVVRVLADQFDVRTQSPQKVKGVDEPLTSWRVLGERAGGPERTGSAARVGRERELERLRQAWHDGDPAVAITGEAGIGKSFLSDVFASEIAVTGALVLRMPGSSIHTTGLHPFRTLLERRCEIGRGVTSADRLQLLRRHLADQHVDDALLPALAAVLQIAPAAGYVEAAADGRKLQDELVTAMASYLLAVVAGHDALLIAEDVHWYDEASLALVAALVEERRRGLRVLITSRAQQVPGVRATAIELSALADDECMALIDQLDPDGVTTAYRAELLTRGAGIPLYVEELVRAGVIAAGADERGAGELLTGASAPGPAGIPEVLYEPLVARLDAIAGSADVASAAAAFGDRFDLDLLAEVLGASPDDLRPVVVALADARILEPTAGNGERYRFRHDLIRQAAEELQPPSTRGEMHGRVADVLRRHAVDESSVDWLTLARHYDLARRRLDALDCYEHAADDARRIGAVALTRQRLEQAIELVDAVPAGAGRSSREISLRLARAFLTVSVEGNASVSATADYERCLELALGGSSDDEVLRSLIPLWSYYASRADLRRATEVAELLRTVLHDRSELFLIENRASFGVLDWFAGHFVEADLCMRAAAADVEGRSGQSPLVGRWFLPNDPTASIYTHLGLSSFVRGDWSVATDAFSIAEAVAAELPFPQGPYSLAYNHTYRSWALTHLGAFDEARADADAALALAERHGFDFWTMAGTTQLLAVDVHQACREDSIDEDQLRAAAAGLEGLIDVWKLIDVRVLLPSILAVAAMASGKLGDVETAVRQLDEATEVATGGGPGFYDAEILRVRAMFEPDPAAAARRLLEAFAVAGAQGATVFQLRIAADLYVLDPAQGAPRLDEVLAGLPPTADHPELQRARRLRRTDVRVG